MAGKKTLSLYTALVVCTDDWELDEVQGVYLTRRDAERALATYARYHWTDLFPDTEPPASGKAVTAAFYDPSGRYPAGMYAYKIAKHALFVEGVDPTAVAMAIAVLGGDATAARALADRVCEQVNE